MDMRNKFYIDAVLPPEMKMIELRVTTTAATADLTPASGKRIRILGYHACSTVLDNLTSTVRATLCQGEGHITVPAKIVCSYRHVNVNNPLCCSFSHLNLLGAVDEKVRLTNTTYTVGNVTTRAIIYYTEE